MTATPRQLRSLGWLLYCTAVFFVISPLSEVLAQSYPLHPGVPNWRFAAIGLLGQSLSVPVFGMLLALLAAAMLGQRMMQTVLSVVCALAGTLSLVLAVTFLLDVLQLRPTVRHEAQTGYDLASIRCVVLLIWCAAVLLIMAVLAWRMRRTAPAESGRIGLVGMTPQ